MTNPSRWPQSAHLLAVLGLLGLNFLLFGDLLISTTQVLSSSQTDIYLHFAAWRQFGFAEIRQGHLPLWNPHYLCGNPFLGGFESALLYPLNWHYLFMPLAMAINWGIILHVFLAGVFTYLWASYRGLHPLAAFLSGVIFMWGGAYYLHIYAGHLPNLCAMVWAPLIFLAIDGLLEKGKAGWTLLGIFAVSMQILAGHPQYVYFTAITALIYFALNLKQNSGRLKALCGFVAFYVGALFVTAAQSWTGIAALLDSARHLSLDFASSASFSFPPQNLLTVFMPNFFGVLDHGSYWGSWYLWEVSLFIGMASFIWVIAAVFYVPRKQRRWILTMTFVTLFIAFGAYTPLYHFFYHYIPLFDGMRGISKFAFLSSLFLAMLAGMGMHHWLSNTQVNRRWIFILAGMGMVLVGTGVLVHFSASRGIDGLWGRGFIHLPWLSHFLASADLNTQNHLASQAGEQAGWSLLCGGFICLILSGFYFLASIKRKLIYGAVTLAVLELFVFARSNRPTFQMDQLQAGYDRLSNFLALNPGDYRIYGVGAKSLVTNGSEIWEDEPMVPFRYAQFVCYSQGIAENRLFSVSPVFTHINQTFGLLRLKYLLTDDGTRINVQSLPYPVMPRMALIYHWSVERDSAIELKTITNKAFNPAQQVLLETEPGLFLESQDKSPSLHWVDHSTDEVEVQAKTAHPCVLLVTDNYSSGWRADSLPDSSQKEYEVLPGDYFLRAVPLKTGYHHFILRYRPGIFDVGKWVSLLSCFLYVAILLHLWKRHYSLGRNIA
jgi:hypothetical protein